MIELPGENDSWAFQHRLDNGQRIQRVIWVVLIEKIQRLDGKERERLVQRELVLKIDVDPHHAVVLVGAAKHFDDPGVDEGPVHADGLTDVTTLAITCVVVADQDAPSRRTPIAWTVEEVEEHRVAHVEP